MGTRHVGDVSGICHGISLGSHTITYAVGQCVGYNETDAHTGWQSSFHIFVEELRVDLVKICSSIPVDCDA
ncbi:hypothetical protein EB796_002637 [Bugula neritina]|uniref:CTHRC1 C-terminal domain-containing protein n=1 Tax=Bugula neritina TaxID=10212 RepID=A0A7J7KLK9_BUGNE|nr:hypothetical protein EB796_002637 [Bugula neritina]